MGTDARQVIAIDWSGRAKGAAEFIWTAIVRDGRLVELDNGRDRDDAIAHVLERVAVEPRTVVGLDFAFSFPQWFCVQHGWSTGREVWNDIAVRGEGWLADCQPPFWGRKGTTAQTLGDPRRRTDALAGAKSVFQIGGAGTVGTGSLRGMPHLAQLQDEGFAVWPFDRPAWPVVLEIYPRLFTPRTVTKRDARNRRKHLSASYPDQDPALRERAARSEHAFDAAISALSMSRSLGSLDDLPRFPPGSPERIEGCIWRRRERRDDR